MSEIKNILLQDNVAETFALIVTEGLFSGTYEIQKPTNWNEVDCELSVNDELFNVEDFLVGASNKIEFFEFDDPEAVKIIKGVYNELGSDGQIIFRWSVKRDLTEIDLLGNNFEINLNKYSESFEKSQIKILVELKKRESQNKLLTREDTTINLFDVKDLDDNDLAEIPTFELGFKKGETLLENFYFANAIQERGNLTNESNKFYLFTRGEDYQIGTNINTEAGVYAENNGYSQKYFGTFIYTDIDLKNVKIRLSNFLIGIYTDNVNFFSDVWIYLVLTNGTNVQNIQIPGTKAIDSLFNWDGGTIKGGLLSIDSIDYNIPNTVTAGTNIDLWFVSPSDTDFKTILIEDSASVNISTNLSSSIIKTKGIRIYDALNQICKNYTNSEMTLHSNILNVGGYFYETAVSTGIYLRGLSALYLTNKMKTSLKTLLYNCASPLMALGFDLYDDKFIVEDVSYFFKDVLAYDFSDKEFIHESFLIENDSEIIYNQLVFGSKKYSSNVKSDIKNFNTFFEASTPIKTAKNKFDKQTDFIIDQFKIQELIEDSSSSTNDNDDDLVAIDLVYNESYLEEAVLSDASHYEDGGYLIILCVTSPIDSTYIEVGMTVNITGGANLGSWQVLEIDGAKMRLNKTSGITQGTFDTPISYTINGITKNRTTEGFANVANVENPPSATNLRHNPKYQMARWWRYFGSGLFLKPDDSEIKITNYKNNSDAQMTIVSDEMSNELNGFIKVGNNESKLRLKTRGVPYFIGQKIEIEIKEVSFIEFFIFINEWQKGVNNDRNTSRGFIKVPTPFGTADVYLVGQNCLDFSQLENTLKISGKVKAFDPPMDESGIFDDTFDETFN